MPAGVIALLALGMFGRYGMVVYQVCRNIICHQNTLISMFTGTTKVIGMKSDL